MKKAVVSSAGLGSCWSPSRFTEGECDRLHRCKYPEKATCKAYKDEIITIRVPRRTTAKGEVIQ